MNEGIAITAAENISAVCTVLKIIREPGKR